jgi:uncharacterized damage-inducible protein DinB
MTATATNRAITLGPAFDDLEQELANTRKILERYPDGKGDWRPHSKSATIGELASHVAQLPGLAIAVLTTEYRDAAKMKRGPVIDSAAGLVANFDTVVEKLRETIANLPPDELDKEWSLRFGDKVVLSSPKRALMRFLFLSHLIHHRAQLGVYYRLLDVPVPMIYGPTADEPM